MAKLVSYDLKQRERVRLGLKYYKERHGIGDTVLRNRIAHHLGIDKSVVVLSTLQRFVAGTHKTDDVDIRRYTRFLAIVFPRTVEDFAAALAKFLPPLILPSSWRKPFIGDYRVYIGKEPHGAPIKFAADCPKIRLQRGTEPSYLLATEFIADPAQDDEDSYLTADSWSENNGVFAPISKDEYLLIVSGKHQTRICLLQKALDAPLTLQGYRLQPSSSGFDIPIYPPRGLQKPVSAFVMSAITSDETAAKEAVTKA